jgi:hypothetical protein
MTKAAAVWCDPACGPVQEEFVHDDKANRTVGRKLPPRAWDIIREQVIEELRREGRLRDEEPADYSDFLYESWRDSEWERARQAEIEEDMPPSEALIAEDVRVVPDGRLIDCLFPGEVGP